MSLLQVWVKSPTGYLLELINKISVRSPVRFVINESERELYTILLNYYKVEFEIDPAPPPGPPYEPRDPIILRADGLASTMYNAGQNLNPYKAVIVGSDQKLYYADNSTSNGYLGLLGVTYVGCLSDTMAKPVTYGIIENPDWDWNLSLPVFLGTNGDLTQYPLDTGSAVIIGHPVYNNTLFVNISPTIGIENMSGWVENPSLGFVRTQYTNYNVVIGSTSVDPSSILELESVTQGFLPPRMTVDQMNNITNPAEGLIVYNTTDSELDIYETVEGGWTPIGYYNIIEGNGTSVAKEQILNFLGASLSVTDDEVNNATNVRINQSPLNSTQLVGIDRQLYTNLPLSGGGSLANDKTLSVGGLTSLGAANQLVTVSNSAFAWEYKSLTAGQNIVIENSSGAVRISSGVFQYNEILCVADATLSPSDIFGALLNNQGQTGTVTTTLPPAAEGLTFVAVVGEQVNATWTISADDGDYIYADVGTGLQAGVTYIQESNQTVGTYITFYTFKTGSDPDVWSWMAIAKTGTGYGNWTAMGLA